MKYILLNLLNSKGLQQSSASVVGNLAATGLSAISLILISRLLGPALFGEFSVGFALIVMVARINDFGLTAALLKFAGETIVTKNQNAYFSITLKYKLFLSLIIIVLGLVAYHPLASILNLENPAVILLAITLGLSAVYLEQLAGMLQSLHKFNQAIATNFIQAGVKLMAAALVYFLKAPSVTLIFAIYAAAPIVPVLFSRWLLPKSVRINLSQSYSTARNKLFGMAKHTGFAFIATTSVEQISILFVQGYLTTFDTGIIGGVSKIEMLFALTAVSLGNVLFPRVARYKSKEDLQSYAKKTLVLIAVIAISFLALLPFTKYLIIFSIGPEYLSGLHVLNLLLAGAFLYLTTIPFMAFFYSFNNSWYFSISGAIQLSIALVGNIVFVPIYGLEATAWTKVVLRLIVLIFTIILVYRLYKKKYNSDKTVASQIL